MKNITNPILPEKTKNLYGHDRWLPITQKLSKISCVSFGLYAIKQIQHFSSEQKIIQYINLVEKWLKNPDSVTKPELYNAVREVNAIFDLAQSAAKKASSKSKWDAYTNACNIKWVAEWTGYALRAIYSSDWAIYTSYIPAWTSGEIGDKLICYPKNLNTIILNMIYSYKMIR